MKNENSIDCVKENFTLPPSRLMEAVEIIPNYFSTVGNAAAHFGLNMFETFKGLIEVATLVGGDLEVMKVVTSSLLLLSKFSRCSRLKIAKSKSNRYFQLSSSKTLLFITE